MWVESRVFSKRQSCWALGCGVWGRQLSDLLGESTLATPSAPPLHLSYPPLGTHLIETILNWKRPLRDWPVGAGRNFYDGALGATCFQTLSSVGFENLPEVMYTFERLVVVLQSPRPVQLL